MKILIVTGEASGEHRALRAAEGKLPGDFIERRRALRNKAREEKQALKAEGLIK